MTVIIEFNSLFGVAAYQTEVAKILVKLIDLLFLSVVVAARQYLNSDYNCIINLGANAYV
jgi:hypothetical protein